MRETLAIKGGRVYIDNITNRLEQNQIEVDIWIRLKR